MKGKRERIEAPSKKVGTLGWLAELYFAKGPEAAQDALGSLVPEAVMRPYSPVRAGEGQAYLRTDVEVLDDISYDSFSPPPLWEAPYGVYRVRFGPKPKQDFMFHSGEEILIPLTGEIAYHFYWSPGTGPPKQEILDPALGPNSVIRINPEVPHHTWAVGKAGAEAWMVFRHASDSSAAIALKMGQHSGTSTVPPSPRRVALDKLQSDPGKYALVAWGLAEKIRLYRQRAGLTLAELAAMCEIHPSYLSRMEEADTNLSLDLLLRVARILHMSLDFLASAAWSRELQSFPKPTRKEGQVTCQPLLHKPPGPRHFLHMMHWCLPSKGEVSPHAKLAYVEGTMTSWIVTEGRVIFEVPESSDGGPSPQRSELLGAGSVIHFRRPTPMSIHGLENSQLLQVVYSADCPCLVS